MNGVHAPILMCWRTLVEAFTFLEALEPCNDGLGLWPLPNRIRWRPSGEKMNLVHWKKHNGGCSVWQRRGRLYWTKTKRVLSLKNLLERPRRSTFLFQRQVKRQEMYLRQYSRLAVGRISLIELNNMTARLVQYKLGSA